MNQEDYLAHKPTKAEQARLDAAMKSPEQRIKELEDRVAELERNAPLPKIGPSTPWDQDKTPWILEPAKPMAPEHPHPYYPKFTEPQGCSVCGMKFEGPMGYVCSHPNCPSRVTCG